MKSFRFAALGKWSVTIARQNARGETFSSLTGADKAARRRIKLVSTSALVVIPALALDAAKANFLPERTESEHVR
jgi:hypothetical protein